MLLRAPQLQGLDVSKKCTQGGTVSAINQDRDPSPQEGTPMWYSGIDQPKRDSVIATYGLDGPRVKQLRVANTPLALAQYVADFPAPHKAVVESTGGWHWLPEVLAPLGVAPAPAHPTPPKAISPPQAPTRPAASAVPPLPLRADLTPIAHMSR